MNWLTLSMAAFGLAPISRHLMLFSFILLAASAQAAPAATLAGVVRAENGDPIAGASVVISSAHPAHAKLLDGVYSHPDCLKHAVTDSNGEFAIRDIEAGRRLSLVIAAVGHATKKVTGVDARDGTSEIILSPPRLKTIAREINDVSGRVIDPESQPVAGALVVPRGYMQGNKGLEGPMDSIAETTVTDSNGAFRVPSTLAVSALHLRVAARGFVPGFFAEVSNGGDEQTLTLKRGATLRGRIVRDGVGQGGVVVGTNVAKRFSGSWNGPWGAITDRDGRFTLAHVVPDKEICVFATMKSVSEQGAPPQTFLTASDETNIDLGDLPIAAGFRLHGRVMLADGGMLPDNLHVSIIREGSADRVLIPIAQNGAFDVHNLPAEILHVNVYGMVEGTERRVWPWPYHLSAENVSLDPHNPHHLIGLFSEDTEVSILLAPGKYEFPKPLTTAQEFDRVRAALERLRQSPLKGIVADREQ